MNTQTVFLLFLVWAAHSRECAAKAIEGTELSPIEEPELDETDGEERDLEEHREKRAVMQIEERSIFDQLQAIARLTGDISRNDIVGAAMDGIILAQVLPLHPIILWLLKASYKVLSFVHPAFWWLFPSTKPANISGSGFRKVSFF